MNDENNGRSYARVTVPYISTKALVKLGASVDDIMRTVTECQRGIPGQCSNSNYVRLVAKTQGRNVSAPSTRRGGTHWSEVCSDGVKRKFVAPIVDEKYAKAIDGFDLNGDRFKFPDKSPFGKAECIGRAHEGPKMSPEERAARRAERAKSGKPPAKRAPRPHNKRELQTAYVQANLASA